MVKRDFYLKRLIRCMWNGDIKVLTGIRHCGKSELLLELFRNYLLSLGVGDDHILKIELAKGRFHRFRNPITLCTYIEAIVTGHPGERFYLFIDDIQLIPSVTDRENGGITVSVYDMLNELKAYRNLDVYVAGSSAKGFSLDIPTEFRGRFSQIHVCPLSFAEFCSFQGGDEQKALHEYMRYGGMPHLASLQTEKDKRAYLVSLYREVYVRDITKRYNIERKDILNAVLDSLASGIGSLVNLTSIATALTETLNEKVNSSLVTRYINLLVDSFLVFMPKRYNIRRKTYFKYPNKYYYVDMGLRNARLAFHPCDPGPVMENILYLELVRRGYSVDVGVVTDRTHGANTQREIDFVVNSADQRAYIQSAFRMDTEAKESSELASLKLTGDFFRKVVVRMDIPHNFHDNQGIFHCNLVDLLLDRVQLF